MPCINVGFRGAAEAHGYAASADGDAIDQKRPSGGRLGRTNSLARCRFRGARMGNLRRSLWLVDLSVICDGSGATYRALDLSPTLNAIIANVARSGHRINTAPTSPASRSLSNCRQVRSFSSNTFTCSIESSANRPCAENGATRSARLRPTVGIAIRCASSALISPLINRRQERRIHCCKQAAIAELAVITEPSSIRQAVRLDEARGRGS
jgi:hypothetical protein